MPKKIKKEKEIKFKNKENKIINVNNVKYYIFASVVCLVLICVCVGSYIYAMDRYHAHASNSIVSFTYAEKVEGGYQVYTVNDMEKNTVNATFTSPDEVIEKTWSRTKFYNFNEEIFRSGLLDNKSQILSANETYDWRLDVELTNGTVLNYSSASSEEIDKTEFAQILKEYFHREIMFK